MARPGRGSTIRRLEPDEERELIERAQAGDRRAVDALILCHIGFVSNVASRYAGNGVPTEDLFSEGVLGLIEATQRFDTARGHRFLTYAVFWIRRSIFAALKQYTSPIRIPESHRRRTARMSRPPLTVRAMPKGPLTLVPTEASDLHSEAAGSPPLSLDQLVERTLQDLGDIGQPTAEESLIDNERRTALERALAELSDNERLVLRLRFGLDDNKPSTLGKIAKRIHRSREGVRQIEITARRKLRRTLIRQQIARTADRQRRIVRIAPTQAST